MSLLIKALNKAEEKAQAQTAKAEQAQAESQNAEQDKSRQAEIKKKPVEKSKAKQVDIAGDALSLSPSGSQLQDTPTVAAATPQIDITSSDSVNTVPPPVVDVKPAPLKPTPVKPTQASTKSAANVFLAKGVESPNQNKVLAMIAGASLFALLGMGFYYYQYIGNQPELAMPPMPRQVIAQAPVEITPPQTQALKQDAIQTENTVTQPIAPESALFVPEAQTQAANKPERPSKKSAKNVLDNLALAENEAIEAPANLPEVSEEAPLITPTGNAGKSKKLQMRDAIASESASISVTKSSPQASVNPTLMNAYEAYNAGKDMESQKLYKQVLQRDVNNVDALLGLAAIATRQGRIADANGWYGKVLEVEPRNSLAQSALLENQMETNQAQAHPQDAESRLKNMLAKQPNDANLHVALGNLYAEHNQWALAQQAYFDAYSLNASAENAFNLAVSLDQMGKSKLALTYYQRALALASNNSNIDRVALEARIAAIQ